MLAFFAVWALVAKVTANSVLLPSPLTVFGALIDLVRDLELFMHAGISLGRMVISLAIGSLLAIPLGTFAGTRIGRLSDRTIMGITLVGICTHPYVLGSILQYVFGYDGLKWLYGGYCSRNRPSSITILRSAGAGTCCSRCCTSRCTRG